MANKRLPPTTRLPKRAAKLPMTPSIGARTSVAAKSNSASFNVAFAAAISAKACSRPDPTLFFCACAAAILAAAR